MVQSNPIHTFIHPVPQSSRSLCTLFSTGSHHFVLPLPRKPQKPIPVYTLRLHDLSQKSASHSPPGLPRGLRRGRVNLNSSDMARNRSASPADIMSRHSGSPAPVQQSKRDKRRAMLSEKLQDMVTSFNANLRPHYEAQANAIQVDINLIHRAELYQNKPLEDGTEDIANLIQSTVGGKVPTDPVAEADFVADAGKLYTQFVHEVNDALEERDVNLTLLHVSLIAKYYFNRVLQLTRSCCGRVSTNLLWQSWNRNTISMSAWPTKNTKCSQPLFANV